MGKSEAFIFNDNEGLIYYSSGEYEKAENFINDRNNGKMWYDIDSFSKDFNLQPHEMIQIQDRLIFPPKLIASYGRKFDFKGEDYVN